MSKYLDSNGLLYFWQKLKTLLAGKVDAVASKGLSTNDYTTDEKTKLTGIAEGANNYTHPAHSAKTSALYKVTVDALGHVSDATAAAKADITGLGIPGQDTTYSDATSSVAGLMSATDKSKLDGFGAASTYALKSDITGLYKYKGSVATVANLPDEDNVSGDVYDVAAAGMNYAWTGTAWDALGGTFSLEAITNSEIDTVVAS